MKTYYFVDEDGTEGVSNKEPFKHPTENFWVIKDDLNKEGYSLNNIVELPKGTIKALFQINLTWNEKPIMIENNKLLI